MECPEFVSRCLLSRSCHPGLQNKDPEKKRATQSNNAEAALLQDQQLDGLVSWRCMGSADYEDACTPVRSVLQKHGDGSVTHGVHAIKVGGTYSLP